MLISTGNTKTLMARKQNIRKEWRTETPLITAEKRLTIRRRRTTTPE